MQREIETRLVYVVVNFSTSEQRLNFVEMNTLFRIAVVFVSIVLLNFLQIESKLSKSPAAVTVVRVGSSVILECFTENKTYPAVWTHLPAGSSNQADVYLVVPGSNNEILGRMTQTYYNRGFRVKENRESGEYSLEIQSVKLEDAGEYKCQARGGLGQSASTQLTVVIDSPPVCESNVTEEVLGPNSCGKDPDTIALTCTFEVRGNSLPSVMWVKTEHLDSVVKVGPAQWTDEPGRAISMFIAEASRKDLTESSFTCIVQTSDSVENKMRFSCKTPRIDVLEIANTTEYRTVSEPEEVQCDPSSFTNGVSCKWVRRDDEVTVSRNQHLNLFRPQMKPGHYVCIVDCDIRGDMCPFEALRIYYIGAASETRPASSSQDKPWVTVTIAVVVSVIATVLVVVGLTVAFKKYKKQAQPGSNETLSTDKDQSPSASVNGKAEHRKKEDGSERSEENEETDTFMGNDGERVQGTEETDTLIPNGHAVVTIGIDEKDSHKPFIPGSRAARLRALEEKAALRMRMNALRGQENPGFSAQDEGGDVAEGIPKLQAEKDK